MRSLNELYTILYNEIKDLFSIGGLCNQIVRLKEIDLITQDEYNILSKHFKANKPNYHLHSEFIYGDNWTGLLWWWTSREDFNPVNRKAFILKMIEITK